MITDSKTQNNATECRTNHSIFIFHSHDSHTIPSNVLSASSIQLMSQTYIYIPNTANVRTNHINQYNQQQKIHSTEISKKALLNKISLLRRDRKAAAAAQMDVVDANTTYTHHDGRHEPTNDKNNVVVGCSTKRQLILNTIADLKRSLEDQSVELCGLNDDDVEE